MIEQDPRARLQQELDLIPEEHLGALVELIHDYRLGLQTEMAPSRTSRFARHAGVIGDEDAAQMLSAIEDCERIDPDGW